MLSFKTLSFATFVSFLLISLSPTLTTRVNATTSCEHEEYRHRVEGEGSIQTGSFHIAGFNGPENLKGQVIYTISQNFIVKSDFDCLTFSKDSGNNRVDFEGPGKVWNGSSWVGGYKVSGYAIDSQEGDKINIVFCRFASCKTYPNPNVVSGNIVIAP